VIATHGIHRHRKAGERLTRRANAPTGH
jgi:hypothetical protein